MAEYQQAVGTGNLESTPAVPNGLASNGRKQPGNASARSKKKRVQVISSRYMQDKKLTPVFKKADNKPLVSTPAQTHSSAPPFEDCDVSVITGTNNNATVPKKSAPTVKVALGGGHITQAASRARQLNFENTGAKPKMQAVKAVRPVQSHPTAVEEFEELDNYTEDLILIMDAKIVRAAYLLREKEELLERNTQDSLKQLWALSCENRHLLTEKTAIVQKLQEMQHWLKTYKQLRAQHDFLKEFLPEIREVQQQMSDVAMAINSSLFETPVKNLSLPSNQNSLIPVLQTLTNTMNNVLDAMVPYNEKAQELNKAVLKAKGVSQAASNVSERYLEVDTQLQKLSSKETSAIIQSIQKFELPELMQNLTVDIISPKP